MKIIEIKMLCLKVKSTNEVQNLDHLTLSKAKLRQDEAPKKSTPL